MIKPIIDGKSIPLMIGYFQNFLCSILLYTQNSRNGITMLSIAITSKNFHDRFVRKKTGFKKITHTANSTHITSHNALRIGVNGMHVLYNTHKAQIPVRIVQMVENCSSFIGIQ